MRLLKAPIVIIAQCRAKICLLALCCMFLSLSSQQAFGKEPISLGQKYMLQGKFEKARSFFLQQWKKAQESGQKGHGALAMKNLGSLASKENLPREAFAYFQEAGIIFKTLGKEKELVNCRSNLATALFQLALRQDMAQDREVLFARSLELYEEALNQGKKLSFPPFKTGATLNNVAALWLKRAYFSLVEGNEKLSRRFLKRAEKHCLQGLKGLGKSSAKVRAELLLNLGSVYLRQGKRALALNTYKKAQALAEKKSFPTLHLQALINRAQTTKGLAQATKGLAQPQVAEALSLYEEAIERLGQLQGVLRSTRAGANYFEQLSFVYEQAIELNLAQGKIEEAFSLVEGAKARLFQSILQERKFRLRCKKKSLRSLAQREWQLSREIDDLHEKLVFHEQLGEEKDLDFLLLTLQQRVKEREKLLLQLKKKAPNYLAIRQAPKVKARAVQQVLLKDEALLQFWFGRNRCFLFVLTKDFLVGSKLQCTPAQVKELVSCFSEHCVKREIAGSGADYGLVQDCLYDLYRLLLAQAEPLLAGKRHYIVSSHSVLHQLPFGALILKKDKTKRPVYVFPKPSYLIDKVSLSYATSAFTLKLARQGKQRKKNSALVMANAIYPAHLSPLEAAEKEKKAVKKAFSGAVVRKRQEATEAYFKKHCHKFALIHLATHGEIWAQKPLSSPIYLTAGGGEDGRLTVGEIFDLSFPESLVMLSGCQTGLLSSFYARDGRRLPLGDDLMGLTRAFLYGGAKSVSASLWMVDDEATAQLMDRFYGNLKKAGPSQALALAQRSFAADEGYLRHPYYWAAFLLLGRP